MVEILAQSEGRAGRAASSATLFVVVCLSVVSIGLWSWWMRLAESLEVVRVNSARSATLPRGAERGGERGPRDGGDADAVRFAEFAQNPGFDAKLLASGDHGWAHSAGVSCWSHDGLPFPFRDEVPSREEFTRWFGPDAPPTAIRALSSSPEDVAWMRRWPGACGGVGAGRGQLVALVRPRDETALPGAYGVVAYLGTTVDWLEPPIRAGFYPIWAPWEIEDHSATENVARTDPPTEFQPLGLDLPDFARALDEPGPLFDVAIAALGSPFPLPTTLHATSVPMPDLPPRVRARLRGHSASVTRIDIGFDVTDHRGRRVRAAIRGYLDDERDPPERFGQVR